MNSLRNILTRKISSERADASFGAILATLSPRIRHEIARMHTKKEPKRNQMIQDNRSRRCLDRSAAGFRNSRTRFRDIREEYDCHQPLPLTGHARTRLSGISSCDAPVFGTNQIPANCRGNDEFGRFLRSAEKSYTANFRVHSCNFVANPITITAHIAPTGNANEP